MMPTTTGGVVIVTSDGPEHRYIAHQIAAQCTVAAILVCAPPPRRKWHKVLQRTPAGFADKALWRLYLRAIGDDKARLTALHNVLGPASRTFPEIPQKRVGRIKDGGLLQTVRALAPDILAVYGTSIIPDNVLSLPTIVTLNMHTGISPRYRGTSCAFWPILNGEPEWVGATVHECTSALDGGQIYATQRATLYQGDSLHHIFARAVVAGGTLYGPAIAAAQNNTLVGTAQDLTAGREYSGSARGLISELRARRKLAQINHRLSAPLQTT